MGVTKEDEFEATTELALAPAVKEEQTVSRDGRRSRILVLNQYYWPGVEATAHLLTELCEALAEDYEVEVVTGVLHGHEGEPREIEHNGVRITRVASTSYERSALGRRAVNYVSYLASALSHALSAPAPDLVLCMTDPPIIGDLGVVVGRRVGAPVLVISQDVFPEIATELDRLRNPAVVGVLGLLVGAYLRRADRIVAIGDTMRERLEAKGAPAERLRVIPNWVDTRAITPQPRDNPWAEKHDLVSRFVVMHSGNVGHAQDLDSLVRAATFLRDRDDLRIVIAGFGARHTEMVELASRLEVEDTVRFLPYQKRERLPLSLSSADIHVVGLAKGLAGYVVPSRLYGILSAGRPVIVAADDESETARLVREIGCGVVIPPARPELLARTIREAAEGVFELDEMGRRGRAYVEEEADRVVAMERYRALVRELLVSQPLAEIPEAVA